MTCLASAQGSRRHWCACGNESMSFLAVGIETVLSVRRKPKKRAARQQELLPIPYIHQVFTRSELPKNLGAVAADVSSRWQSYRCSTASMKLAKTRSLEIALTNGKSPKTAQ